MVAAREHQLSVADQAEGSPAEYHRALDDRVDPVQLGLRLGEAPLGDRAEGELAAELDLVVAGAQPLHDR